MQSVFDAPVAAYQGDELRLTGVFFGRHSELPAGRADVV
jgi:hypothetical protein